MNPEIVDAYFEKKYGYIETTQESDFVLPKYDEIMYYIRHDENGDNTYTRLSHIISVLSTTAIVKSLDEITENHSGYRCFDKFHFDLPYSYYEYNLWLGSCVDLADNAHYKNINLKLKLKPTVDEKEFTDIINKILPRVTYTMIYPKILVVMKFT